MTNRASWIVGLTCALASTASGQSFHVDATSSSISATDINLADDALTVTFEVLEFDDYGQVRAAVDNIQGTRPVTHIDVAQAHCLARQYAELVHAVTSDRTLLDALVELGNSKLTLAVLDARDSWTALSKYTWQHLPAERDSRFDYGVRVSDDELVVNATLGRESCYAASASQLAQGLRQLLHLSREDAPAELRRLNDALISRAKARAATK